MKCVLSHDKLDKRAAQICLLNNGQERERRRVREVMIGAKLGKYFGKLFILTDEANIRLDVLLLSNVEYHSKRTLLYLYVKVSRRLILSSDQISLQRPRANISVQLSIQPGTRYTVKATMNKYSKCAPITFYSKQNSAGVIFTKYMMASHREQIIF